MTREHEPTTRDVALLLHEADKLAAALRRAEVVLSKIRTPGAVALTTHHDNTSPYVRDVAEDAMHDADAALHRWGGYRRRARRLTGA